VRLLRSELTKLTSTPTNAWLVAVYCLVSALLGFAIAYFIGSGGPRGGGPGMGRELRIGLQVSDVIRGANVTGVIFALGVLVVASEERHGLLSQTFVSSSPCRHCVLGAKAAVATVAAVVAAVGGMLAATAGAAASTFLSGASISMATPRRGAMSGSAMTGGARS
jgi:hypothetical protein